MEYKEELFSYLDIIKRRKFILIISLFFALVIGSTIAYTQSSIYRSEARIFYVTQQIPERVMTSFANIYLETAISWLETLIFSRDRAIAIIKEIDLYPDLLKKMAADDVIIYMRDQYRSENVYESIPGPGGRSAEEVIVGFRFSFDDRNPKKAFEVATIIASEFLANYKKFREGFATVTSSFLQDEQQHLKEEMAKNDKKISEFKEKHLNELPELFQSNYSTIQNLNEKLLSLDQEERFLTERKILLESQLAQVEPLFPLEGISGERILTPEEKLASLQAELAVLLTRVSEKHPDIIRIRREIEGLEKIVSRDKDNSDTQKPFSSKESFWAKKLNFNQQTGAYNPTYVNFVTQLEDTLSQIRSVNVQKDKVKNELETYNQRLQQSAIVEKEYNLLMRDLESSKKRYDELVNMALTADTGAAMEQKEIGGKLILAEPPNFPLRPIKPNRPLIVGAALLLGLVFGLLVMFSWEFLNQTIRSTQDLSKITPSPVLLELPEIKRTEEKRVNKIKKLAIPLLILLLPIVLFVIDKYYSPLELDITFIKIVDILKKKFSILGL
jgi:uncharacterized protein involved in exopolysaccharide biosynthesis